MSWFPFSRIGIEFTLNIGTIWLLLEAFEWRPWVCPPWRKPLTHFYMTALLSLAVVIFAVNVMTIITGGQWQ